MERLADALPLERAASRWIVSSDPDEQVEKIGYYVGLGFSHLVFHAPGPDQARFLDLYGEAGPAAAAQALRMNSTTKLELLAIPGLPMIKAGDDLAALIAEGFRAPG